MSTKRWSLGIAQGATDTRRDTTGTKRGATSILTSGKAKPSVSLTLNQLLLSKSGAVCEQKLY